MLLVQPSTQFHFLSLNEILDLNSPGTMLVRGQSIVTVYNIITGTYVACYVFMHSQY